MTKKPAFFILFFYFIFIGVNFSQNSSLLQKRKEIHLKIKDAKKQEKADLLLELGKTYLKDSISVSENLFKEAVSYNKTNATIYLNLAQIYLDNHFFNKAENYIDKGIDIALKKGDYNILSKLFYRKGDVYYYQNNYEKADNFYKKAIIKAKRVNNFKLVTDILVDRSYIYDFWAKREKAIQLLDKAFKLSDSIDYIKGKARASLFIGNIYDGLGKYNKALDYYFSTLKISQKNNIKKGIAISYCNIGVMYFQLEKFNLAIQYLEKSIPLLKRLGDIPSLTNTYGTLGLVYSKLKNRKLALFYIDKAISEIKKNGNDEDVVKIINEKADILHNLAKYNQSNIYLDTCIAIAKKIEFGLMLQKSYESYANNLQKTGNFKKAFYYLKKHNQVKDSILTDKFQKRLADFETKYKTLEKQAKIENLEHKEGIQKLKLKLLQIISGSVIALLLITGFVFYQKRKKEKQINALKLEKSELLTQNLYDQLDLKNKQLTSHAINMLQKNELLAAFKERIDDVINIVTGEASKQLKNIKRQVNKLLTSEKDWETFKIYFEQVNNDFLLKLKNINPKLTTNDIRLATLIKLNMTNKEIVSLLNINYQSVKNAQHRLKTKLNLDNKTDLRKFLNDL